MFQCWLFEETKCFIMLMSNVPEMAGTEVDVGVKVVARGRHSAAAGAGQPRYMWFSTAVWY